MYVLQHKIFLLYFFNHSWLRGDALNRIIKKAFAFECGEHNAAPAAKDFIVIEKLHRVFAIFAGWHDVFVKKSFHGSGNLLYS